MSNDRKMGLIVWGLCMLLCTVLIFSLEHGFTRTLIITIMFVCFAFISFFIFQSYIWKKGRTREGVFLKISSIIVSYFYLLVQIPICIIFSIGSNIISYKIAILVNMVLVVIVWGMILGGLVGNEHIEKVNNRQKNHHIEL